jgi:hypothetical protein
MLTLGGQRARDDLVGGVVAAHGVDGQHRTAHRAAHRTGFRAAHRTGYRAAGPGHHQVPCSLRAARAGAALGRALRPALRPALVRSARGPSLRMARGRAQRVTQGVSGRG